MRLIRTGWFIALASLVLLGGCEQFFTNNAFSGLQRDPANMSEAQLLNYSADALASGDRAKMKSAFDALKEAAGSDPSPEAASTLVDLGNGATNVAGLITQATTSGGELDSVDLSDFDDDTARATADIALATDGLSGAQYASAAVGLLAAGAKDDGFDSITVDDKGHAEELLDKAIAAYEADGKGDTEAAQLLKELRGEYTDYTE